MKRVTISLLLVFLFSATFAMALDIVYVSYCRNGTPPSLRVKKLTRSSPGASYAVSGTAILTLAETCGLTDIQHQGSNQLHVYYTDSVGNKVRIVRETLDLATFEFLAGATKAFPANLAGHLNFDTNDVQSIGLKAATNKLLHSRQINSAGNFAGPFKPRGKMPFTPFNSHISNGEPFFTSSLWFDSAAGKVGITFQNLIAPTNARSFIFSNRVFAHDTTLSFPRPAGTSTSVSSPDAEIDFWAVLYELLGATSENTSPSTTGFAPSIRKIRRSDFTPVGVVIKLDASRPNPQSSTISFNGIAIDPLGTLIAFNRHKPPCGSNELVFQTFNPGKGKKIGKIKVAEACNRSFNVFGISVLNDKFLNGVTPD